MRIKYNLDAFEEIRRSPGVTADVNSRAARVAAAAGEGYESSPYHGRTRNRASVITATHKARLDNAKNNTLLRSLDAGR